MTVKLEPRRQFAVEYSSQHNAERWPRPRQYLRVGPTRLLSFLVNSQRCESFREARDQEKGEIYQKYVFFHSSFSSLILLKNGLSQASPLCRL